MTFVKTKLISKFLVAVACGACTLFPPFASSAARGADTSAIVGEGNGDLSTFDINTGSLTVIKSNGTFYDGLAFNANESVLYGTVSAAINDPSSLVTINQTTGSQTVVGANGTSLRTITNLSNGELFGVDTTENLYRINPGTGAATLIGSTGLNANGGDISDSLASNGTSLFYTLAQGAGESSLYTLNLSTGAASLIGDTGVDGIVGSAFAGPTFQTGQLYGFLSDGDTDLLSLSTGAATDLNTAGPGDIYGGVGIVTAAKTQALPEPMTPVALIVLGLILIGSRYGFRARQNLTGVLDRDAA